MFFELAGTPLPVHAIGFLYESNAENLKNLYAVSRVSGGFGFEAASGTDILGAAKNLAGYLTGITYLEITLPEQVKDGAVRPLTLSDSEGVSLLRFDLHMPRGEQAASHSELAFVEGKEPEPVAAPEPPARPDSGRRMLPLIAALVIIVIAAAIGFGVRAAKKKKTGNTDGATPGSGTEYFDDNDDHTQLLIADQQIAGAREILLVLNNLTQPHRRFETVVKDTVEIGRKPNTPGIAIDYDKKISKRHCSVTRRDASLWVEDLGSTNKTFLNGAEVTEPRKLNDNDILSCGKTQFTVRIEKR